MTVENDAADLLEELGLQLYRVADDKEALDDALHMAERLREERERVEQEPQNLGELHIGDPKPMDEVKDDLEAWIEGLGITEGDTVYDKDAKHEWQMGPLEVVEVTDVRADAWKIEEDEDWNGAITTVADVNPAYHDNEPVIVATPDGSDKEYAYPASRLKKGLPEPEW